MPLFPVNPSRLNDQQRRIAEFISRNAARVPYLTVDELAEETGTSTASVSRFARLVGFSGFKELKSSLRRRVEATPRSKVEERIGEGNGDLVGRHFAAEIENLRETAAFLTPSVLEKAGEILCCSQRLFVYAGGPNEALAHLLRFRFRRYGYDVRVIGRDSARLAEEIAAMRKHDAFIGFGFFRESEELLVLLQAAGSRGVGRVLITDLHVSQMRDHADLVIQADRGKPDSYHSLVAPVAVVDCLILAVAAKLSDEAANAIDNVTAAREEVNELRSRL